MMLNKQSNYILAVLPLITSRINIFNKLLLALIVFFLQVNMVNANSLDGLVNAQQLRLTAKVKNAEDIIARQPVILQLQIATDRWFSGGINVAPIAMKDVVLLTDSELVINGSERINGQTWATQLREITIYPMKPGIYTIPPIAVNISVNQASGDNATGTLYTKPLTFSVDLPEQLLDIDNYVVSSDFTVEIEGNFEQATDAQVGNAITQTITFSAENVPAMMLPQVAVEQLSGVSIYQKPAVLADKSNRGILVGKRQQSLTYFFEKPGKYRLKEQRFYWWNIDKKQLDTVIIPEMSWSVNAGASSILANMLKLLSTDAKLNNISSLVMLLIIAIALITSTIMIIRNRGVIINQYKVLTRHQYRQQKRVFFAALTAKKYNLACQLLYHIIDLDGRHSSTLEQYFSTSKEKQQLIKQLLALAYNDDASENVNFTPFTAQQGRRLLTKINLSDSSKSVNIRDFIRLN